MESVFTTTNLRLGSALTAAGFQILKTDKVIQAGREVISLELQSEANGVKASELQDLFENKANIDIEAIIAKSGLSKREYAILAFDAARAAGHNRVSILHAVSNQKPLKAVSIGGGRTLIYREGTPKSELQRLCR
jgi:hypothetical protein